VKNKIGAMTLAVMRVFMITRSALSCAEGGGCGKELKSSSSSFLVGGAFAELIQIEAAYEQTQKSERQILVGEEAGRPLRDFGRVVFLSFIFIAFIISHSFQEL
jgi:hypothetical protein